MKKSNEKQQCLTYWYVAHGHGIGKIIIAFNKTNNDTFVFHENEQSKLKNISLFLLFLNFNSIDTNWKQIQRIIDNDNNYELIFTYESNTSDYNYIAIDDISITNGVCLNKFDTQRRRKRRQSTSTSMLF